MEVLGRGDDGVPPGVVGGGDGGGCVACNDGSVGFGDGVCMVVGGGGGLIGGASGGIDRGTNVLSSVVRTVLTTDATGDFSASRGSFESEVGAVVMVVAR